MLSAIIRIAVRHKTRRLPVYRQVAYWGMICMLTSVWLAAAPVVQRINTQHHPQHYALGGYDPVAYFINTGAAVKGLEVYQTTWRDVTWLFSSEKNLQRFQKNPAQYTPQYGGYCAWGISQKQKLYSIDPTAWSLVGGKLYFAFNKTVLAQWKQDHPRQLARGNAIWKKLIQLWLEQQDNKTSTP